MEITAVSSLMANSSNNNTNTNNNNNTHSMGNKDNDKPIDKDIIQSHQQRAQFIMSTKGINNYIASPFANATDGTVNDVIDSSEPQLYGTNLHSNPLIIETENNLTALSDHDSNESNLREIVELVDRILSEVESKLSSNNNHLGSTHCVNQAQNSIIEAEISLNIASTHSIELPKNQTRDSSPDEATSDLIIDADIPSNDSEPETLVTLRNLEITPPPQPPEDQSAKKESGPMVESVRSKRQRVQTKLFQAGEVDPEAQPLPKKARLSAPSAQKSKKRSSAPPIIDKKLPNTPIRVVQHPLESQDVIFYEKNDYLAVRNEENSFYLCQLAENVKIDRPLMKIRWLDTKDEGKTYFLTSQYDKVYQKSIIMPVIPNILKSGKKGEQLFSLDDQVKANIMDRLSKSLSAQQEAIPAQSDEQVT